MTTFEGSFLGAADKISPQAIMECKVCWTPYDPAEGDDSRQIDPGTAFLSLPDDWSCPTCSAPKEQFLVREDPGAEDAAVIRLLNARTQALVTEFTEVWHGKMRDVPMVNKALRVEAVGFRMHEGRPLGVLISPWFMNLVLLSSDDEDWSDLATGEKDIIAFPSGRYEFLHNVRDAIGGYKACSLFSPMGDFNSQAQAVEVASAVMTALFDPANKAETDRTIDIRAAREAEMTAAEDAEEAARAPSRRSLITGNVARPASASQ